MEVDEGAGGPAAASAAPSRISNLDPSAAASPSLPPAWSHLTPDIPAAVPLQWRHSNLVHLPACASNSEYDGESAAAEEEVIAVMNAHKIHIQVRKKKCATKMGIEDKRMQHV
jgi:hypothetical protein